MRIEQISDNQIRCTLTRSDLADRELKLSELAYGTEKAKKLFKDMMNQAYEELGFEADNAPLMIEAVPLSNECIMLIVTRVDDPEELDTRFSRFSPSNEDDDDMDDGEEGPMSFSHSDEILDIFKQLRDDLIAKHKESTRNATDEEAHTASGSSQNREEEGDTRVRIFEFATLDEVCHLSEALPPIEYSSVLYKNPVSRHYFLVLTSDGIDENDYKNACHLASEFGHPERATINTLYYYDEHYDTIIGHNALATLRQI